jgi:hypothetical protein
MGLDHEEPETGEGLTSPAIFLLVSLPLFITGGVLFSAG